jgi:hypothetical protein
MKVCHKEVSDDLGLLPQSRVGVSMSGWRSEMQTHQHQTLSLSFSTVAQAGAMMMTLAAPQAKTAYARSHLSAAETSKPMPTRVRTTTLIGGIDVTTMQPLLSKTTATITHLFMRATTADQYRMRARVRYQHIGLRITCLALVRASLSCTNCKRIRYYDCTYIFSD